MSTQGRYVEASYERDARRITTRVTADGRDGYPVEAGRYRLVVSRARPWAHRAIIVRRLLGLEDALSMGICGPTHDRRSWTFDLDPGGVDPVLRIPRLQDAYFARQPHYPRDHRARDRRHPHRRRRDERLRAAHPRPVDRVARVPARGAPDLYPEALRAEIDAMAEANYTDVNNGVYRCGFAGSQDSYDAAYERLWARLDVLEDHLAPRRYLVGDHVTEADIRLFTTLVRFDAVYHGHFKCNRSTLSEMPILWAYARDLFQTRVSATPLTSPTSRPTTTSCSATSNRPASSLEAPTCADGRRLTSGRRSVGRCSATALPQGRRARWFPRATTRSSRHSEVAPTPLRRDRM